MSFDCENQVNKSGCAGDGDGDGGESSDGRRCLLLPWRARVIGTNYKTEGQGLPRGVNKKTRGGGRETGKRRVDRALTGLIHKSWIGTFLILWMW